MKLALTKVVVCFRSMCYLNEGPIIPEYLSQLFFLQEVFSEKGFRLSSSPLYTRNGERFLILKAVSVIDIRWAYCTKDTAGPAFRKLGVLKWTRLGSFCLCDSWIKLVSRNKSRSLYRHPFWTTRWEFLVNYCGMYDSCWTSSCACVVKSLLKLIVMI